MLSVSVRLDKGAESVVDVVRALDTAKLKTTKFAVREPSLDDVFLAVTGHAAESEDGTVRGRGRKPGAPKSGD